MKWTKKVTMTINGSLDDLEDIRASWLTLISILEKQVSFKVLEETLWELEECGSSD